MSIPTSAYGIAFARNVLFDGAGGWADEKRTSLCIQFKHEGLRLTSGRNQSTHAAQKGGEKND